MMDRISVIGVGVSEGGRDSWMGEPHEQGLNRTEVCGPLWRKGRWPAALESGMSRRLKREDASVIAWNQTRHP